MKKLLILDDSDIRQALLDYVLKKTNKKIIFYSGTLDQTGQVIAIGTTGLKTPYAVQLEGE